MNAERVNPCAAAPSSIAASVPASSEMLALTTMMTHAPACRARDALCAEHRFPEPRGRIEAPNQQGVYIIYSPSGRVMHVGRTPKGRRGIVQRLGDHLHARSSFTNVHLDGDGAS